MLRLIEEHDQSDLVRCWTWVYLSRLVGTDLTKDSHYAINEDGSEYDDDVGGPAYIAGRDGVDLDPLSAEQDAAAKKAAQDLFMQRALAASSRRWSCGTAGSREPPSCQASCMPSSPPVW